MSKKLSYKILAAVLALNVYNLTAAAPALAEDISGDTNGTKQVTVEANDSYYAVYGTGSYDSNEAVYEGKVIVNGAGAKEIYGGFTQYNSAMYNNVIVNGGNFQNGEYFYGASAYAGYAELNEIEINDGTFNTVCIYGGYADTDPETVCGAYDNKVVINGGEFTDATIYGAYANSGDLRGNELVINGGTISGKVFAASYFDADVYEGDSSFIVSDNSITLMGTADVSGADLYGLEYGKSPYAEEAKLDTDSSTNNNLIINNWSGEVKSVQEFDEISFENIVWDNSEPVLEITDNQKDKPLADTKIKIKSLNFAGGSTMQQGSTIDFITGDNLGIDPDKVEYTATAFTSGVALEGTGIMEIDANGNLVFKTLTVQTNEQTKLLTQTQAAAAAFVNQGTDLINDSLDVIGRDGTYGVKTFAAVQGNRSKYDVADDLKINGWSVIAGFGAENEHKGGDFAWGVFYENGSGNYRTYNHFNNEFFRGDGSMVYNGGGVAARYENSHGVYTEGSLRAGMLKNEMDNALRDASGASYSCDTESAYYGAHIGVGQIFELSESSDLDVYGKFFHTYTEGDTVMIAGDKFDFDSITSDRLRVGARLTTNKANAFSAYYGLAYEYEFNGDADMTAQGIKAPTESFGGSSVLAELGLNYQPTPDSPWNFDLNLRGYAGERKGGSFNVQATYTF